MSAGVALPFKAAAAVAVDLLHLLEPACGRIQVAGSLRRRRQEVHDIELVATPRLERERAAGLFAEHTDEVEHNRLEELLDRLRADGTVWARDVEVKRASGRIDIQHRLGSAYQALVFRDMPVDLFITDRERWGCIFALRTGPGDWNTRLVTDCKAIGRRVEGGHVERWDGRTWVKVATPEEPDFFAALGQPWLEPPERHVERIRIDRAIADAVRA